MSMVWIRMSAPSRTALGLSILRPNQVNLPLSSGQVIRVLCLRKSC